MCLEIKKTSKKYTAKKDLVCYKHLILANDKYYTPYQLSNVEIGREYSSGLMRTTYKNRAYVGVGLHSFKKLSDCVNDANQENQHQRYNDELYKLGDIRYVIVKCIIPAESKYYFGNFCFNTESYASNKIK